MFSERISLKPSSMLVCDSSGPHPMWSSRWVTKLLPGKPPLTPVRFLYKRYMLIICWLFLTFYCIFTLSKYLFFSIEIPIVPGTDGPITNKEDAVTFCQKHGLPVILKVSVMMVWQNLSQLFISETFHLALKVVLCFLSFRISFCFVKIFCFNVSSGFTRIHIVGSYRISVFRRPTVAEAAVCEWWRKWKM